MEISYNGQPKRPGSPSPLLSPAHSATSHRGWLASCCGRCCGQRYQSIPFLATSTGKDRVVLVYSDNIQVRSKKQQSNPAVEYNVHEEESNDVHIPVPRPRSSDHALQELEGVALQSLSQCPPDSKAKNAPTSTVPSRRNSNSHSLTPSVIVNVPTPKPGDTPESYPPSSAPPDSRPHIRISSL